MSQLNVDNIQNRTGSSGGPNFPSGISVAVGQTAYIHGNLQVDGTETIINTETLNVADKTVGIGSTSNASNTTADGSGIEVFASSSQTGNNKTLTWGNTANSWEFGPNDVGLKVGVGVTIYGETGIVSATSFKGDGSQLTGIDATAIQTGNTSVQTVDTGSDGHVKMTTEGGERVRIGPAGQIGLGGANYGTSGQVLTSAGSGSAPSWSALPAGGNEFTAVANGTIAVGKPVITEADGKVAQVVSSESLRSTPSQPSAERYVAGGGTTYPVIAYDTANNLILHGFMESGLAYVRPNNFQTNTFGSSSVAPSSGSGSLQGSLALFYDQPTGKGVMFYLNNNQVYGSCFTPGSSNVTWEGSRYGDGLYHISQVDYAPLGNSKYIIAFRHTQANPDTMQAQICTVASNGSISWGSATTLVTNSQCFRISVAADTTNSNKAVVVYSKDSDGEKGYMMALDISGTTITAGSESYIVSGGQRAEAMDICWNASSGKYVVFWEDANNSSYGRANVITLSGTTTLSAAATQTVRQVNIEQWHSMDVPSVTDSFFVMYENAASSEFEGKTGTINSNGTITWSNPATYRSGITKWGNNEGLDAAYYAGSGSGAIAYMTYYAGSQTNVKDTVLTIPSSNANCNNIVGFSAAAYTNGQTATIKTVGNVIDNQSGLTPGTGYFIQGDGTLGTAWDSSTFGSCATNANFGGTAIAADKLLIRDPNAKF